MKLYTYYRSSAAYRLRIALNLKEVPYEAVPIHLLRDGGEQHSAQYRQANPQGLVPAIEEDGRVLTQSLAIIEYLEERFPEPALLPTNAQDRAIVRSMALVIACDVHPLNNLRVLNYLRQPLGCDDAAVKGWYAHWIAEGFTALEALVGRHTGDGKHCFGSQVTLADVCLVPQMFNARRFQCDVSPYAALRRISETLEQSPAFIAARPDMQPDAE
jgi:maleylacetoacetate isomerase